MKVIACFLLNMGIHSRKEPYYVSVRADFGRLDEGFDVSIQLSFDYEALEEPSGAGACGGNDHAGQCSKHPVAPSDTAAGFYRHQAHTMPMIPPRGSLRTEKPGRRGIPL